MEGSARQRTHEWRFRIGAAFPADNPLARFIVAVARAMDDTVLANGLFVQSEQSYKLLYFFNLASSHLYEAAETFRKAHNEWDEVQEFVALLDNERHHRGLTRRLTIRLTKGNLPVARKGQISDG
jgi:hypothetical protein